ncbi:MAG TPA: STAS domain-containing protein [Polyangiaceae bacterium]|jgi:anti-anti-sigma factor|nr:STAS domain-containing protein [Polyangiaceae bacterium]
MTVAERPTEIDLSTFSTKTRTLQDAIFVTLKGNADMDAHDQLKRYLDDLHRTAKTAKIKEVVFDLQELYFMNSSCLSLFLRLLNSLAESSDAHTYSLRFRSNPRLHWQRRCLSAVRNYAQERVVIE